MSGPADDPDLLAAEYVLGCLEAEQMRAVEARAEADPGLRATIAVWQARLAPLASAVPPVHPPPDLWTRLQASIAVPPASTSPRVAALPRAWRSIGVWRAAAAGALAVAAALAVILVVRRPAAPDYVAALASPNAPAPSFLAEAQTDGSILVRALAAVQVPGGRDLELWALPVGAQRPVSLGVLPATGTRLVPSNLARAGTRLLVSLEPSGGSPTGQPTGPVLLAGTLTRLE